MGKDQRASQSLKLHFRCSHKRGKGGVEEGEADGAVAALGIPEAAERASRT